VGFRFRGVIDVRYRFFREAFDEPDIPAPDARVRRLVQRTDAGRRRSAVAAVRSARVVSRAGGRQPSPAP